MPCPRHEGDDPETDRDHSEREKPDVDDDTSVPEYRWQSHEVTASQPRTGQSIPRWPTPVSLQ